MGKQLHIPVLVQECLRLCCDIHIESFCDVTVGAGGHAKAFLEHLPQIQSYHGWDRDSVALMTARETLKDYDNKVLLRQASFQELSDLISENSYDAILADLGMSSMQLDSESRGFSFRWVDGDLDMRMDNRYGKTAADVLNFESEKELGRIFKEYGEEPLWRRAAEAIVMYRRKKSILKVGDLIDATSKVFPSYRLRKKIHPLTLIFQALRVFVNKEHEQLQSLLNNALSWLKPGGRLIIISFCSTEDRHVKFLFREAEKLSLGKIITKKVVMPLHEEVRKNPRSRSAKLRCFEKL